MGKNKLKRKKRSFTIPLATVAGVIAAVAEPLQTAMTGNYVAAADQFVQGMTGYSFYQRNWDAGRLMQGAIPIIVGGTVSSVASKLGINRKLSRIPVIRI